MTLFRLRCPGCGSVFDVRLGMQPTEMTRFYLPCPDCQLPIRGHARGDEIDAYKVHFDADQVMFDVPPSLESPFVTVDPYVPSRYGAVSRGEFGTFPTQTLLSLVGDEGIVELLSTIEGGREAARSKWPAVRRLYEYYLAEDWNNFSRAGAALFGDWREVTTAHERATAAHQAVGVVWRAIVGQYDVATETFLRRYHLKHTRALENVKYVSSAQENLDDGRLPSLQRSVFDIFDLYVSRFDSWNMGILRRALPAGNERLLHELTLFRDEFDIVRDLYQQGFEAVCKTLRYPVAAQNTLKRGSPDDFGPTLPPGVRRKSNPQSLRAFDELPNAVKVAYVAQVPGWSGFAALLNNRTRNAIGHASARHDLRTGLVISDTAPAGVPYLDLIAEVFGMFDALGASLQVLRSQRVVSSPDFGLPRPPRPA